MTPREHQVLVFLETYMADAGYAPTFVEIADHIGVKSRSSVHRMLTSLERQGRIERRPETPRAITILNGTTATGSRGTADILAAIPTDTLRMELNRRQEANHG